MGIPNKFDRLGAIAGDKLPAGYLAAEFLEAAGNDYLTLPLQTVAGDSISWSFDVQYTQFTGAKQAEGKNGIPYFFFGIAANSTWYWGANGDVLSAGGQADFAWHKIELSYSPEFTGLKLDNAIFTTTFDSSNIVIPTAMCLWRSYNGSSPCFNRKKKVKIKVNNATIYDLLPCIDLGGTPAYFNIVTGETFHSEVSKLIVGMTPEQARQLSRLPVTADGALTVSLPWEAQYDIGVQSALDIAATNGWIITVQYRDPEVATTNIPISFLEIAGYERTPADVYQHPHFDIPLPAITNTDDWEFSTVHAINFSTGIAQAEGYNGTGSTQYLFYGANASKMFYAGSGQTSTTSTYNVDDKPHTLSFRQKGTLSYATFDDQEIKLNANTSVYPPSIGVFVALKSAGQSSTNNYPFNGKKYNWRLSINGTPIHDLIPVLDPQGIPCMYDRVTKQLFYNSGTGSFIAGFNTLQQARKLATLPDVTTETDTTKTSLTVSLPWEAQWDAVVQAALQVAADRGWTITVQYRDPEITTTNIPISFLESTGTQYIDTLYVPNNESGMLVNYKATVRNDYMVIGVQDVIDGTTCTIYPVRYDATGYNVACWGAQGFYGSGTVTRAYHRWESTLNWRNDRLTTITSLDDGHSVQGKLSDLGMPQGTGVIPQYNRSLWFFGRNNQGEFKYKFTGRIYFVKISQNFDMVRNWVPVLTTAGTPCMFDLFTKQPFYNSGTGAFIAGFDTVEQARRLAYLPDVTAETDTAKKSLTVSLPWEAQLVITGVPAALQAAADRGWIITVQYRDLEADNAYYNKYAACTTRADIEAVNPDYINDLTADGEWVYPLPNLESFNLVAYQEKIWTNGKLKKWRVPLPKLTPVPSWWFACPTLEYMDLYAPEAKSLNQPMRWCGNVTYCKIYAPKATVMNDLVTYNSKLKEIEIDTPSITNAQGAFFRLYGVERLICAPDMFQNVTKGTDMYAYNYELIDFPTSYPALTTAPGMFESCEIPGQQAIEVLNSLPTHTDGAEHAITLGIHIDHQNDAAIDAAVTAAEEKGWTVSVQWNGTETVQSTSAFGLRKPPIYAKPYTTERQEGTTEQMLDWGHYVTNWEENGYQEFSSIEEAQTHFNINQTEEV